MEPFSCSQDRGLSKIFGDLSALHSKESDEGEKIPIFFAKHLWPAGMFEHITPED